jgi:hypothetical protein
MLKAAAIILADGAIVGALWLLASDTLVKCIKAVCGFLVSLSAGCAFGLAIATALMQFPGGLGPTESLIPLTWMIAGVAAVSVANRLQVPASLIAVPCYVIAVAAIAYSVRWHDPSVAFLGLTICIIGGVTSWALQRVSLRTGVRRARLPLYPTDRS